MPSKSALAATMKQALNFDSQIKRPSTERSELMSDAKQNKHVDPQAFNVVKMLFKLADDNKLKTRLAHLRFYLDHAVDAQGRTLDERAGDATLDMFEEPERKADEDGEPDVRPRHLRQPGASGADIEDAETAAGRSPTVKH